MVTTALRIDAFAQPFLAVGLVHAGALQGAGDTKSPMYSTTIGMWLIRVVGVYVSDSEDICMRAKTELNNPPIKYPANSGRVQRLCNIHFIMTAKFICSMK
ncbi:MATE family efflux transporter [Paenibacillus sp. sgz5001063]|uniref:MATE family efflux transporter n=1 Tax=Paenibacillus sp. sgz5001063 TaxID=3242474 RepID=UPI0036D376B0